jgi:hypothetical protein
LLQVVPDVQQHVLGYFLLVYVFENPFVLQKLFGVSSLLGVSDQHFSAEVFGFFGGRFPNVPAVTDVFGGDLRKNVFLALALEGWLPAEHDEREDAEGPNVH